jgi:phosphonate transport system permease protein
LTLLLALLLWPGLKLTEFDPGMLFDARSRQVVGKFLATFFPLDASPEFLGKVWRSTLETLAIATVGTTIAMLIALPLSLIVARSLSISRIGPGRGTWLGRVLRYPARSLLILLRSIPEIVWALLFVRVLGPGPAAGVLAIGITYGGMLGKVYSEIFESEDTRPLTALLEAGSGRLTGFFYGMFPLALPELVSYTVYRWECAVRASAIMGFVGAGGLGMLIEQSLRMMVGGEVATILLVFLLLVALADVVSAALRRVVA